MPISPLPEHKIGIFVHFWPSEPPFSGISSTKSRFLCFFGLRDPRFRAFRAQNRGFCARLLNWMSGLGHFPADRGIVAPAQPILPLTLPPLHLRSRCTCGAVAPAQPSYLRSRCAICHRLSPPTAGAAGAAVATAAAPAEPLHLRSRCICAADTTAAYHRCT